MSIYVRGLGFRSSHERFTFLVMVHDTHHTFLLLTVIGDHTPFFLVDGEAAVLTGGGWGGRGTPGPEVFVPVPYDFVGKSRFFPQHPVHHLMKLIDISGKGLSGSQILIF